MRMKLLLVAAFTCAAYAQTLQVTPARALADDTTVVVRATGLTPGECVAIHAELTDGDGSVWASQAEFVADATGAVDTSKQAPVAMISGGDDRIWHSAEMADTVIARLKHNHFAYASENLKYAHAGHGAGHSAIQPAWRGVTRNPVSGRETEMGGSVAGNAESALDAIPKVLAFLARAFP